MDGDRRWREVVDTVAAVLPRPGARVVVEGPSALASITVERLAAVVGTSAVATGPRAPGDVVVWVRAERGDGDGEHDADVVLDLHDPSWPLIRHIAPGLDPPEAWHVAESRAFFGVRASTWDTRFGDDLPAYAAAVAEAGLRPGWAVLDVGCGTGRALPALRAAVGPEAAVIGVDITPQMLEVARAGHRDAHAALVLGDARRLPVADGGVDAVFAAGLVMHLPDIAAGLAELARVTRPGGRLVLFHPSGRAALAARRGRTPRPDEPLNREPLDTSLRRAGWRLDRYDDAPHRFLALATRQDAQTEVSPATG